MVSWDYFKEVERVTKKLRVPWIMESDGGNVVEIKDGMCKICIYIYITFINIYFLPGLPEHYTFPAEKEGKRKRKRRASLI